MRVSALTSAVLHMLILAIMYTGLPLFTDPKIYEQSVIIEVEIVDIADITNLPDPTPEPKPEPKPEPEPEPAPEPEPKPEPEPEPAPKVVQPVPTPKVKPKKKTFDLKQMKALLDKKKKEQAASLPKETDTKKTNSTEKMRNSSTRASDASLPMTLGDKDALRQQVQKCWILQAGAEGAESLKVTLNIKLNQEGKIIGYPKIVNGSSIKSDVHRVAAESAVRAVMKCQPYKLPLEKYESWREVTMNFDPKDMFR